jgi:hypothetical protein
LERWLSNRLVVSGSVYERQSTGMTIPDPAPGEIRSDRPLFRVASNRAQGVELSLRLLDVDWSGSLSYAFADSRLRSEGFSFPSPADVRHALDFSLSRRLTSQFRVSSAFSYSSGVPYTRFVIADNALRLEEPYARRSPAYASADLSIEYNRVVGDRAFGGYLQLRNVFNRRNHVTYSGSPETCSGGRNEQGVCAGSLTITDRFDRGIPLLPLIGMRVVF